MIATKKRPRLTGFFEDRQSYAYGSKPHEVDKANRVIKRVKIIGMESPNGHESFPQVRRRKYTKEALLKAIPSYEGISVYVDHTGDPKNTVRKVREFLGRITGVGFTDGEGLFGNLEYVAANDAAALVVEVAERMPEQLGLSPHHFIDGHVEGDAFVVTEIGRVASVDVVYQPATTQGFFEHRESPGGHMALKKQKLKPFLESLFWRPADKKKIAVMEDEGMMPTDAVELPPPEDVSADEQAKAAFRAMVVAAFDDESLDSKATIARIKQILDAQEKLLSGGEAPAAAASENEEEDQAKKKDGEPEQEHLKRENAALKDQIDKRDRRDKYRSFATEAKVDLKDDVLETLVDTVKDDKKAKAVIESMPKLAGGKPATEVPSSRGPSRGTPAQESAVAVPEKTEDVANWLLN